MNCIKKVLIILLSLILLICVLPGQTAYADENPDTSLGPCRIQVTLNTAIGVSNFSPATPLTLQVFASPSGTLLFTDTQVSDANGSFYWNLSALGWPVIPQPGMEIVVSDGMIVSAYTIMPFSVDEIDLNSDIIRGTGQPGCQFYLAFFHPDAVGGSPSVDFGEPLTEELLPKFTIDDSGHWEFNCAAEGFDMTPDYALDAGIRYWGDHPPQYNGITSQLIWDLTNPQAIPTGQNLCVFTGMNMIVLDHIVTGTTGRLIVLSEPGGELLIDDTLAANAENFLIWGGPLHLGKPIGIDLQPGMEVSVTWGNSELILVIADLRIQEIDIASDSVSGIGPAGEAVTVLLAFWNPSGPQPFQAVSISQGMISINTDGQWTADFATQGVDITEGMAVIAFYGSETGTNAIAYAEIEPEVELENEKNALTSLQDSISVNTESSDGSKAEITVPAAALPEGSLVNIAAIANEELLTERVPLPEEVTLASGFMVNALSSDGVDIRDGFHQPLMLEFTINATDLPAGAVPGELLIAFWNGAEWVANEVTDILDNHDGTITLFVSIEHLTIFGVIHDRNKKVQPGSNDPLDKFNPAYLTATTMLLETATVPAETVDTPDGLPAYAFIGIGIGAVVVLISLFLTFRFVKRKRV